ncbi:pitrilysin family protein [Methylovorus sp. MP688]|uniref:M16 family metallopeptidase n=1 Tax=Methylovorus sp. (strain MP688) TaxID=887061 RepID=UPI0001EC4C09|nr:pitrilysin family protein [Methylovorus sp. MP688]ADQ85089.1 peptidase M16 domain protein [Methylovorus sp. MP688]
MLIKKLYAKCLTGMAAVLLSVSAQAAVNIQQWKTANGADVYFVENHDLPIIDLSVNFAAGSARDVADKSGLAGMTRYLMTLGAAGMSDEEISRKMADVGAIMGGELDADRAAFKLRTLSQAREREQALDIFAKVLQQPDFPQATLEREKARAIAGLQEAATQPESIASKAFMKALYGKHPYALDDGGEPETIAALKRDDLQAFYQQHYGAKGAVIAMIGDMTREEANQVAERLTAKLPAVDAQPALPAVAYPERAVDERIQHPATQSHILLGYPGVKRGDADYFPLYVGNYILGGGGFVSRLTEEVREKRGLVYSVYSYFMPMAELGPFQIGLQTKREQSAEAMKVVEQTLEKFMQGGVTEAELVAAKQNITGGFPLRLDSNSKILDYLAVIGFYKLPLTYLEDFNKNINSVTTAQIKDAFSRRIDTHKLVTVVVGGN